MREFAQKTNQPRRERSFFRPVRSAMATFGLTNRDHLANQALKPLLDTDAEGLKAGLTGAVPRCFGHDFSRIPIHPPPVAIQTKLALNTPGDQYEQEADRIAEQVIRVPETSAAAGSAASSEEPGVQRKCSCSGSCDKCQQEMGHEHDRLGMKDPGPGDAVPTAVPRLVHEVLRTSGQPLDQTARALMEPRFGKDFSQVRVHLDSQAGKSARDIGSLAYTVGRDIVFAPGQFAPHTASGQRLLAHELAHTVQQGFAANRSAGVGESAGGLAGSSLRPVGEPMLRRQPGPETRKEEGGEKVSAPAESVCKSPSDIALPCSPQGLSDADFTKTGAPRDALGFTQTLKQGIAAPEVLTQSAGKGKKDRVVILKTSAEPIPCESFFTKAGTVWRTISLDAAKPKESANAEKCRGSSYLRQFTIKPDGEKKIGEAEMEHCTDFKHAFDISIGCFATVVNDFARKKTEFPSQDAAVDAVTKLAGRKPDTWMTRYVELLEKTEERDTKGWHRPVEPKGPVFMDTDASGRCLSAHATEIDETSFPEVSKKKHPTSDVIK